MELRGGTAVVTEASSGIGRAVAGQLADVGQLADAGGAGIRGAAVTYESHTSNYSERTRLCRASIT